MRIDPRWREACVVAVASALGLLLNRFGVSILPDAGLYFGGIFYLAVALRFGPVAGASAALISSLTLVPHFGWPVLPVVCAEAFTVGAMARRGMQAPLGELLFWALAGTPFTLLAYIGILHDPSPVCWVLIVTPPLNGFSNAIVAQLLEVLPGIRGVAGAGRGPVSSIPMRRHLSRHFASVSALPLLLVTIVSGRFYVDRQYNDARDYSSEAAFAIRENIDAVVVRHLSAVESFAGSWPPIESAAVRGSAAGWRGWPRSIPTSKTSSWPTTPEPCWARPSRRRRPCRRLWADVSAIASSFSAPSPGENRWSRTSHGIPSIPSLSFT